MKSAVCLDIGGTYVKYSIITEDGKIFNNQKERTCKTGREGLVRQVMNIISRLVELSKDYEIKGIGISSGGQVDNKTGKIIYATDNLPGWTGVELGKMVSEHFKMACFVENDVNAAALGELYYGNGKGYDDFVCLTIGTGIGGALVQNGKLVRGAAGSAGEIGHMIIKAHGRKCNCGNRGCYEQYASVTALKRDVKEKLGKNFLPYDVGVEWLFERYGENDKVKEVVDRYIDYISTGIVSLLHVLNPSLVIIGGAVSASDILIKGIEKSVKLMAMPSFLKRLKIMPAYLDNKASLYGVASYVFEKV